MRLPELFSIVVAAFGFSGRRKPHLSHLSRQNHRWRSDNSIKAERCGQSFETLRQPFTHLFQSTAEWKHFLLPLITKIESQLMKINLGSPTQGLQHGLFHCKHTHTFIYTMPAPAPTPQVPERKPERVLRRVSNGPEKDGEKLLSIRLSINPPQGDHKEKQAFHRPFRWLPNLMGTEGVNGLSLPADDPVNHYSDPGFNALETF